MLRSDRYSLMAGMALVLASTTSVAGAGTQQSGSQSGSQSALAAPAAPAAGAPATPAVGAPTAPDLGAPGKLAREVGEGDVVAGELPKELQGIEVIEKVGTRVPTGLVFRDEKGKAVELGTYLDGTLPVILTFNYTSCPMLCSVQLNALLESIKKTQLDLGKQYRIVTVSLDPKETPESAGSSKDKYVSSFPAEARDRVRAGWHFLTGDAHAIQTLADAVGFHYRYLERTKEYVHPATLIFLSPQGVVTRYFHGVHYPPDQLDASIFKAGAGEHGVSLGFILACFRHDPDAQSYAKFGERAMRYGALGFVVLMILGFGAWQLVRARRARQSIS